MQSLKQKQEEEKVKVKEISDPLLDVKIERVCAGLQLSFANKLKSLTIKDNIIAIIDYINSMMTEINLSSNYRKDVIRLLTSFSETNNKNFKEITRNDVISFLESYRKTETQDPLHKWIATYNIFRIHLLRFFKWLYSPDLEPDKRRKAFDNIPRLKRKEISTYKPSDLWTPHDDLLFLKYCASKRNCCYHAISRDLSARPHEILKL